jgi:hypothetical protein
MNKQPSIFPVLCAVALICLLAPVAFAAAPATLDDTAKVLAGLPPAPSSPLAAVASGAACQQQYPKLAQMWEKFEERQLSKARAWGDRELPAVRRESPVLYYTFSGPDILYANAFFPDCRTYVLCGLEPVGRVPDLESIGPDRLGRSLSRFYGSLKNFLALSFFKTKDMGSDFRNEDLPGTTPVLMTFLARLGKTVRSVELISLDRDGNESPRTEPGDSGEGVTPGVRIAFDSGPGTPEQTVYYFTADISNKGLAENPGFANFCRKLEPGAGFAKAASYLMHGSAFSATRDFLLERCKYILQDDTAIPASVYTERKWSVRPYGRYVRTINEFRGHFQKDLAKIYASAERVPLDFGVGYYYRVDECNMILAVRDGSSVVMASAAPTPAPRPSPSIVVAAAPTPAPAPIVVAANMPTGDNKTPRKKLVELEAEELRIRKDPALDKKQRMEKLREIWKLQLEVMGKKAA